MPLYEYRCHNCNQTFEKIQSFSAPDPTECPKCGKGPLERLLSAPAIQFKGSGFYLTDYGKTGGGSSAPKGEGSGSSSSAGDSGASKPAAAPSAPASTPSSGSGGSSSSGSSGSST